MHDHHGFDLIIIKLTFPFKNLASKNDLKSNRLVNSCTLFAEYTFSLFAEQTFATLAAKYCLNINFVTHSTKAYMLIKTHYTQFYNIKEARYISK